MKIMPRMQLATVTRELEDRTAGKNAPDVKINMKHRLRNFLQRS